MVVNLRKGQKVDLSKDGNSSKHFLIGLGWDMDTRNGVDCDLDASVFCVDTNNKVRDENDFIFYNNLEHPTGCVKHKGDNRTGQGEGDDEQIEIDLTLMPDYVERVIFAVTIHNAFERDQNFGQVKNAFIRVVDLESNQEVIRYDLTQDYSIETAIEIGALYRKNGGWKFDAIGAGYANGLAELCNRHGLETL